MDERKKQTMGKSNEQQAKSNKKRGKSLDI